MKEVFLLTKVLTKSSNNGIKQGNEKKSKAISRILLILFAYLYLGIFMGIASNLAISALMTVGMENIFIYLAFFMFCVFIIVQTIISSINILYFSKDLEFLMPLPIKPIKIIMAKINCLIINAYLVSATLIAPVLIVYGFLKKLTLGYYITSLITLLVFPIIPILITVLLVTIIMRPMKKIISKDVLQYISFIFTFILIIGIQKISNMTETTTVNEVTETLISINNMIRNNINIFFNVDFASNAVINFNSIYGIGQLGLFVCLSFVAYYLVSKLISRTYLKTVTTVSTTKNKIEKVEDSNYKECDVKTSYVKKEFANLFRNPIFFIQCIFFGVVFPVMFLFIGIANMNSSGVDPELFLSDVNNIINSSSGIIGIMFLFLFCFLFNYVSVTAISREGNEATFAKYIPIPLEKQIKFKALPGIIVNDIIMFAIIIGACLIVKSISIITIISALFLGMLLNRFNNILFVIVDLKNPKLKWISEYTVVKQNINMIYQMLIYSAEMVVLGLLITKLIDLNIFIILSTIVLILMNIGINMYIKKKQKILYEKIV